MSENEIEIVWEAPPVNHSERMAAFLKALAEVKKTPGRWARMRVWETSGGAYSARKSIIAAVGADEKWEIVVRRTGNAEEHGIWARYRTPEQVRDNGGK